MHTLWRGLVRVVFWSFERGTWPYDVAVAVIVVFVLLSPRSWFADRPRPTAAEATAALPAAVELRGADPADGAPVYRVDARLVAAGAPDLERQLREVVRKHVRSPAGKGEVQILRVEPVRGRDGTVAYYDVRVKP